MNIKSEQEQDQEQAVNFEKKVYDVNGEKLYLYDDFDFDEEETIMQFHSKLSAAGHTVSGKTTNEEVIKILSIILRHEDESKPSNSTLKKIRISLRVKIIADFFLSKALFGTVIKKYLELSALKRNGLQMSSTN